MPRDADATRRRLLAAATTEFGDYGLAGARVDRIARAAGSNKAQIYHYFGSKDALFDAVFRGLVVETVDAVPFDARELPGYAGRLFDAYERDPVLRRIATWRRLERGAPHPQFDYLVDNNRRDVEALARVQADGQVPTRFAPAELLTIVLSLAAMWMSQTPELSSVVQRIPRARRRAVVVDAVTAILAA